MTSEINFSHFVSRNKFVVEPMIVIPMAKILVEVSRIHDVSINIEISKMPADKILVKYEEAWVEIYYNQISLEHWDVKWALE